MNREQNTIMAEKLSVCIPAYNEEKCIGLTLDSVFRQRGVTIDEILVGINSSTDGTKKKVEEYALRDRRIKVVDSPKGKANAWNALNARAVHKYRIFQDGDCPLVSDDVYETLLRSIGNNDIIGGSVLRGPQSLSMLMKIVSFPYRYYKAYPNLNGNLYLMNYEKTASALKRHTGSCVMPAEIINDDIFLQIMADKIALCEKVFVEHLTPVTISDQITRFHRIEIGNAALKEKYGRLYEEKFEKLSRMSRSAQMFYLFQRLTIAEKLLFPFVMPLRFILYRYIHYKVRKLQNANSYLRWK